VIRFLFSKETRIMSDLEITDTDTPDTETGADYAIVRGWTPERQTRFLDHLAEKGNVRAACKRVGLSREAAYRLRRRDPLFARGWAAAMGKAHEVSIEVLADRAIEGIEEPIYHRGELVGTRRKYDTRLLLAHIARMDKLVDDKAAQADAARFDELLARIAGENLPADMGSNDGVLPLDRKGIAQQWATDAQFQFELNEGDDEEVLKGDALAAYANACGDAYEDGRADGARRWDSWFGNACERVDHATGWDDEPPAPGLPGGPPLPRLAECENAGSVFNPRTVSDVSTGALDRALAGPANGFVPPPPPVRSVRQAT